MNWSRIKWIFARWSRLFICWCILHWLITNSIHSDLFVCSFVTFKTLPPPRVFGTTCVLIRVKKVRYILNLIFFEKFPRNSSPVTGPLIVGQEVFGQLCVDGLSFWRSFKVGLLLEEHVYVVLQQPQVGLVGILILKKARTRGSIS